MKVFRTLTPAVFLVTLLLLVSQVVFSAGNTSEGETPTEAPAEAVGEGFFLASQVDPGYDVYDQHCAICHGYTLMSGEMGGPPLTGPYFYLRWGGKTVGELLDYVHNNMPLGQPRTLSATQYANVVAYVLDFNGFPAGEIALEADSPVLSQTIVEPAGE